LWDRRWLNWSGAKQRQAAWQSTCGVQLSAAQKPAVTIDGLRVEVVANIGNVDDARRAIEQGAEGVGLFRT
jgi:phosphoenolpyruvate-protein kinase (PTS system EI component)